MNDTQDRDDLAHAGPGSAPPARHALSPQVGAAIAAQPRTDTPPRDAPVAGGEDKPPAFVNQGSDSERLPKTASQPEQGAAL